MSRITRQMVLEKFEKEVIPRGHEAYKIKPAILSPRHNRIVLCLTCGRIINPGEEFYIVYTRLRGTKWTHQRTYIICSDCRTGKSRWWNNGEVSS